MYKLQEFQTKGLQSPRPHQLQLQDCHDDYYWIFEMEVSDNCYTSAEFIDFCKVEQLYNQSDVN